MYVLVLGLDVLGNPFGLIRGLSEGVEAFFYEPFQVRKHTFVHVFRLTFISCTLILAPTSTTDAQIIFLVSETNKTLTQHGSTSPFRKNSSFCGNENFDP